MSKFIDRLNRLSKGGPQPIGFTARQAAAPEAKIQVVASLLAEDAESLTGHLAGADAGLLRVSKLATGTEALRKLCQSVPDIIWGGWLEGGTVGDIKQLTKAGADFIVCPAATTPLAIMKNNGEVGKILEVEASLSEGLLRTANELPVDAVLIAGEEKGSKALTWQQLMVFQRFSDLLTKPLLALAPPQVTASELQALWEAGVMAVVLEISPKEPTDRLSKLRQEINKLEFPSRRARRAEALAPHIAQPTGKVASEEDGEEEEDREAT